MGSLSETKDKRKDRKKIMTRTTYQKKRAQYRFFNDHKPLYNAELPVYLPGKKEQNIVPVPSFFLDTGQDQLTITNRKRTYFPAICSLKKTKSNYQEL